MDYLFGLGRNRRLKKAIGPELDQAQALSGQLQQPVRLFTDLSYSTLKSWSRQRRVVAVFTYIDPGMGTPSELHSWGEAHRPLWQMLRESGRRVEVVAVAWEQRLLDRAERVLTSWRGRAISDAEQEAIMLRQAIADTDWETLERHGGFNAAVKKIVQWEQENPASEGRHGVRRCPAPESLSCAGQAAISRPLACRSIPKPVPGPIPLSGTAGLTACGETRIVGSIRRENRPVSALCWTFSGSEDL